VNQQPENIESLLPEKVLVSAASSVDDFSALPAKPAVYVLIGSEQTPVLLAATADLRRAVQNRLMPTADENTQRLKMNYREITDLIRYRIVGSAFAASWWYYRAARSIFPAGWRRMTAWKNAWFISIDLADEFPRFWPGQNVGEGSGFVFGPIAGRTTARSVVRALEEMFDLCRYYEILRQAPRGQACAYKQMGKCPAPCDGTIPISAYHGQIHSAMEFLFDEKSVRQDWRRLIQEQMRQTATKMEFRIAAALKNKLIESQVLDSADLHYANRLDRWGCLSFQYGQTFNWIEPFLIRPGAIETWPQVRTRDLAQACGDWWKRIATNAPQRLELQEKSFPPAEVLSLVCYHLHRSRDAGCYIPLRELHGCEMLEGRLNAWLAQKRPLDVTEVTSSSDTGGTDAPAPELLTEPENNGA
jgi:hypothetical protein